MYYLFYRKVLFYGMKWKGIEQCIWCFFLVFTNLCSLLNIYMYVEFIKCIFICMDKNFNKYRYIYIYYKNKYVVLVFIFLIYFEVKV